MTILPEFAAHMLTWFFLAGLAGSVIVIVLFIADLIRVITSGKEQTTRPVGDGV